MTIEREISFFGLVTWHRSIKPGKEYKIQDNYSLLKDEFNTWEIAVVTPDIIREITYRTLLRDRFGWPIEKPLPPKEKILLGKEINYENIHTSLFPGVQEKIIWKPTKRV